MVAWAARASGGASRVTATLTSSRPSPPPSVGGVKTERTGTDDRTTPARTSGWSGVPLATTATRSPARSSPAAACSGATATLIATRPGPSAGPPSTMAAGGRTCPATSGTLATRPTTRPRSPTPRVATPGARPSSATRTSWSPTTCPAGTSRATTSTGTRCPARWMTATVPSTPASSKASPITTRRSIRRSRAVDRGTAVAVISRLLRRPHQSHVSGPSFWTGFLTYGRAILAASANQPLTVRAHRWPAGRRREPRVWIVGGWTRHIAARYSTNDIHSSWNDSSPPSEAVLASSPTAGTRTGSPPSYGHAARPISRPGLLRGPPEVLDAPLAAVMGWAAFGRAGRQTSGASSLKRTPCMADQPNAHQPAPTTWSRPTAWAAYAAWALALLSAVPSFYWAAGGTIGLDTVGGAIEDLARARDPAGVALGIGAGILKVAGGLLALALVRPWGQRVPRRLLLGVAWAASVILMAYGGLLVAVGALVLAGAISPAGPVDRMALWWHVVLWDLWFLVWGLLLGVAAWHYGRESRGRGAQ